MYTLINKKLVSKFDFLSDQDCDQIKQYAYQVEEYLVKQSCSSQSMVTTNNHYKYNFFASHPTLSDRFASLLSYTYKHLEWPILVQSWVNIYRKNQGIQWHNHNGHSSFSLSANIFIDGDESPGITYQQFNKDPFTVKNKKGEIHIFPCELYHMVPPVKTDRHRITVGITVHSFPFIQKHILNQIAANSKVFKDVIILTNNHLLEETNSNNQGD